MIKMLNRDNDFFPSLPDFGIFDLKRIARRWWKILSSANFFKLLTTFYPIERFLADSILLEGTQPCERGSFWHPASFWIYSGIEVTAVFVGTLFQQISFFPPPIWLRLLIVIFLYLCVCIFVFVYFLYFCVYFVYLYLYLKRLCAFSSLPAAHCCSPLICRQSLAQIAES